MQYRSQSRGMLYSAPPTGDREEKRTPNEATAEADEADETAEPELLGTTDANWTGQVPADD
ncbi:MULTISPECIES: hypothetical protein [Halorussus]|uniref:hypothetical protein n=1 Tax=Halorussus TaxID=1070314 RepID=UPI0020A0FFF7|nr:hypothetical protein [Halorussus vallis]USZ74786.1 hypothetical protein NGM07_15250 [Halorussus vallis]